jgi:DNA-binding HxlR family transcriptional regulator
MSNHVSTAKPDAFLAACPSRDVIELLGEKWAMLIIVALEKDPVRFGELQRMLEGISKKMLAQSLRRLEENGILNRTLYDEMPLRVEYNLTPLGRDCLPLIKSLKKWAEKHLHEIQKLRVSGSNNSARV